MPHGAIGLRDWSTGNWVKYFDVDYEKIGRFYYCYSYDCCKGGVSKGRNKVEQWNKSVEQGKKSHGTIEEISGAREEITWNN